MKLDDIDDKTLEQLDAGSKGYFSRVKELCRTHDYEAHLTIQTDREGLEEGQMKLFVQIVKDGDTVDYAVARLGGSGKIIGYNLYLADLMDCVRGGLDRGNKILDALDRAEAEDRERSAGTSLEADE